MLKKKYLLLILLIISLKSHATILPYIAANRMQKERTLLAEDIVIDIENLKDSIPNLENPDIILKILEYLPGNSKTLNYLARSKFCSQETIQDIAKQILEKNNIINKFEIDKFLNQNYKTKKNNITNRLKKELIRQLYILNNFIKYTNKKKNIILNRQFNQMELNKCIKNYKDIIYSFKLYLKNLEKENKINKKQQLLEIKNEVEEVIKASKNDCLINLEKSLNNLIIVYYFLSLFFLVENIYSISYSDYYLLEFIINLLPNTLFIFPLILSISVAITILFIKKINKEFPDIFDLLLWGELSYTIDQLVCCKFSSALMYFLRSLKYMQLSYEHHLRRELVIINKKFRNLKLSIDDKLNNII